MTNTTAPAPVMERAITVITPPISEVGEGGLSIPVTFNTMLVMLGAFPVIHFTLPFDSGFAKLCAVMEHPNNKRHMSAAQCARALELNKRLDSRVTLPTVSDKTYIMSFKAKHLYSQEECVKAGADKLISLFAMAHAYGITKHHRASCYLNNLQPCKFNDALAEVFARAVAVAIAHYSSEVKEFDKHLDSLIEAGPCTGLDCDLPCLIPSSVPSFNNTATVAAPDGSDMVMYIPLQD